MARFDPDRVLSAQLDGLAQRLVYGDASIADAVSELRALAAGRTDILARTAGIRAGAWSMDPRYDGGVTLLSAGLLVRAGADDADALARWVSVGRDNIARQQADVAALADGGRHGISHPVHDREQ